MRFWEARPSWDEMGMATALLWAERSTDPKVKVGAALLDHHHRVIGVGYNGRAAGEEHGRESLEAEGSGYLHAEDNLLMAANWNGERHTLYVTHAPCAQCARRIVNSRRVVRVVYRTDYVQAARVAQGLPSGPEILRAAGIEVLHVTNG